MKQLTIKLNMDLLSQAAQDIYGDSSIEAQQQLIADSIPEILVKDYKKDHFTNLRTNQTLFVYNITENNELLRPQSDAMDQGIILPQVNNET